MLGKCAKVILLWTAFFAVLWLCYGMVGTPSNVMAYIFCSAMSVATFVPAMYETILLVGYMMLENIPSDDEMDEWDDARLNHPSMYRDEDLWDVTIGTKDGMFFHLYQDDDPAFEDLFVGELCEQHHNVRHIMDRQHFTSQRLCVDWFMNKTAEIESWSATS
jgi:hypothetical protein